MQSKFSKWVRENKYNKSAAWELKLCKNGHALAFSAFQEQQLTSLYQAKHACVYKKLSDFDPSLKPYDASQICNAEAWVVAGWHHDRKGITAYWIDIDIFLQAQKQSERKSMTESQANLIAYKIIHL